MVWVLSLKKSIRDLGSNSAMRYLAMLPNHSFQRTPTPAGCGPLNSNRWRGASRLANGTGVDKRPVAGASAGQQVVRADQRFLTSHASVLRSVSSAAQFPFR